MIDKTYIVSFTCDKCGKTEDRSFVLPANVNIPDVDIPVGWVESNGYLYCGGHNMVLIDQDEYEAGSIMWNFKRDSQDRTKDILTAFYRCGPFRSVDDFIDYADDMGL
jgi:hypothetical protein